MATQEEQPKKADHPRTERGGQGQPPDDEHRTAGKPREVDEEEKPEVELEDDDELDEEGEEDEDEDDEEE
jgi:hypothetical protein